MKVWCIIGMVPERKISFHQIVNRLNICCRIVLDSNDVYPLIYQQLLCVSFVKLPNIEFANAAYGLSCIRTLK
ncbi:hypothetical protein ABDS71_004440 [Salmonella enterica]|nr:hypothetical protein [Salmonella enterica subsp. enterica]ECW2408156.1 hypothetical protein [Salmonella enterica]EDR6891908.1 hypothetical protein [Salmonella enterica subsp. enterica serovar Poona]EDT7315937.1 hypothetical protein [Salmonella enterica subsp. enterica]EIF5327062.1 hypothetical protein [Salmonella enterica subsp. enterica serovar Poona]